MTRKEKSEQFPFTIKCKNNRDEKMTALQWIEQNFPNCRWATGELPTRHIPNNEYGDEDIYFILCEVISGYDMYWAEELEDNYDVYEFSKLISKVDLPSKECLMDFLCEV